MGLNAIFQAAASEIVKQAANASNSPTFGAAATSPTSPTSPTTPTSPTSSTSSTTNPNGMPTQDEFLQMLVTQLQNQDPTQPMDQTAMLAQLAQFSSLQEMTTLNGTMTSGNQFAELTQSASLIGKSVTTTNTDGTAGPAGVVAGVVMQGGQPYLEIGNQTVAANLVTTVSPASASTSTTTASPNGPTQHPN